MKVLDDDADEHVQHEEPHEQQERDEVDEAPFVEVLPWLQNEFEILFLSRMLDGDQCDQIKIAKCL